MSELCYLSATDALAAFRAKTLSPVELMEAVIARAEAVQPDINAFTYRYFEQAMDAAAVAERKYVGNGPTGVLEGLPVGIKDESHIAGFPTSNGSLCMKDFVAEHSSTINARIIEAGGIVHARTATPEFSCAAYTWSRLWGVTRNPWNPAMTPGGSSGGSAASLAAGTASLCTGSDIGGSIRIPASACGVVGYKPPYGRNPEDAPFNLDFCCHTGPLARSVTDAALLQNVMCGPDPRDISTLKPKLVLPSSYEPISGWRIAVSRDLGCFQVDPEVQRNTDAALDVFRSLGAVVEDVDLEWPPGILEAAMAYLTHGFGSYMGEQLDEHGEDMTSYARAFAEAALDSSPRDYLRSLEVAGQMYSTLGPLFERYNVLVCPTTGLPAVAADFDQSTDTVLINGVEVDPVLGWVMTTPFNMLSRCPVISVPSGHASNAVPTGIQIVGATYSDVDVFRAAIAYEAELGGWYETAQAWPTL